MNRIVLAVGLCTLASGALAQSSVIIYGVAEVGIARISDPHPRYGAHHVTKMQSGMLQGSRLGFKGTETLTSDLSALYTIEAGYLVDTGESVPDNLLFGRQAFVGLHSRKIGTLTMGRQYGPEYESWLKHDPMSDGFAGAASNLLATNGKRVDNAVKYATPTINGVEVHVLYGFGEVPGNTNANRDIGASVSYTSGPVYFSTGYNRLNNATDTGHAVNYIVGLTYAFPSVKVHSAFAHNKGAEGSRSRDILLGVTVPLGPHTVMASYIHKDDRTAAKQNAHQIAFAYSYGITRRTVVYFSGAKIFNRNGATYRTYDADAPSPANGFGGGGTREFNFGIRHAF